MRKVYLLILGLSLSFSQTIFATTFYVENNNDSGLGSLREAIISANADPSATPVIPHIISFAQYTISNSTITLLSSLPEIINHINIDAKTHLNYINTPIIKINATLITFNGGYFSASNHVFRFELDGEGSQVSGFYIYDLALATGDKCVPFSFSKAKNVKVFSNEITGCQAIAFNLSNYCEIYNNNIHDNFTGFWGIGDNRGTIIRNNIIANSLGGPGLLLKGCSNLTIRSNEIYAGGEGVAINLLAESGFGDCYDNLIKLNNIHNVGIGILIQGHSSSVSPYNTITENRIYNISKAIELEYSIGTSNKQKQVPIITPITTPFTGVISGTSVGANDKIEIFEGAQNGYANNFLGSVNSVGGVWTFNVGALSPSSTHISATATDIEGLNIPISEYENTSELVSTPLPPPPCPTGVIVTSSNCIGEKVEFQVDSPDNLSGLSFSWTFQDGYTTTDHTPTTLFTTIGIQMVSVTVTGPDNCSFTATLNLSVIDCKCCETVLPTPSINISQLQNIGHFYTDNGTGQIVWQNNNCPALYPFDCIKTPIELQGADGVISASVVTLSDNWKDDPNDFFTKEKLYPTANASLVPNIFETGEANKWRVEKTYTYREKIDQNGQDKNYNRGTFPITMFDWKNEGNNDPNKWVKTSTITKYSPNGQAIEEENILKIKSTAQYGYNGTLQTAVAQNAGNHAICFESFENIYNNGIDEFFENGISYESTKGVIENGIVHTGNSSIKLNYIPQGDAFTVGNIKVSNDILIDGLLVKTWVYIDKSQPDPVTEIELDFAKVNQPWLGLTTQMYKISSSGEWMLYEGLISGSLLNNAGIGVGNDIKVGIRYNYTGASISHYQVYEDNFNTGSINTSIWQFQVGAVFGNYCGIFSSTALEFNMNTHNYPARWAKTKNLDLTNATSINFDLSYGKSGTGQFSGCEPADLDEEMVLGYTNGVSYTEIKKYTISSLYYDGFVSIQEPVPSSAKVPNIQLVFKQINDGGATGQGNNPPGTYGDTWAMDNFSVTKYTVDMNGVPNLIIDDVRMQPKYSEMACYVYDKAQRLTAAFDDQHYALIYQYNAEGILIRKLKETVRGVKTISETQYNSKGTNR